MAIRKIRWYVIYKNGKRQCMQSGFSVDEALQQYVKSWVNGGFHIDIEEYTAKQAVPYEDYTPLPKGPEKIGTVEFIDM